MNRMQRLGLLAPILALAACAGPETGFTEPSIGPFAYVRLVHAVPDTGNITARLVNMPVENLNGVQGAGSVLGVAYRTVTPWTGITPGSRVIRVFPATTNVDATQQVMGELTHNFAANTYYTLVFTGSGGRCSAQIGQPAQFVVIEDQRPTVAAGQFALRALLAAPFAANQDAYVTATATSPITGAPTFAGLQWVGATGAALNTWVQRDTGAAVVRSFNAGTTTGANLSSTVTAGAFPEPHLTGTITPLPGSRVTGSALTAFLFPPALGATCAATNTAGAGYGIDVRFQTPQ